MSPDLAARLAALDPAARAALPTLLGPRHALALTYAWPLRARPAQLPPAGAWRTWLIMAGRGWGKSKCGIEWVRGLIESGRARRVALVGATAADVRDVLVEGPSGVLNVCPHWDRPRYEPSKRRLTWPNGATCTLYSAEEPSRLRGPQHDAAFCDELCYWTRADEAWHNLMLGLRIGADPRVCVATTPRRIGLLRALLDEPTTALTKGSTYENRANLAPQFFDQIVATYEGTRLGLQELHAELSEIAEGAWFPSFGPSRHVTVAAEYCPGLPVTLAIDCGTSAHTGAVFLQVREDHTGRHEVHVFGDYHAEGLYSRANAEAIRAVAVARCGGRLALDAVRLDPASGQRTGVGPVVRAEYEQVFGRRIVGPWPLHPVLDGLDLIEILLGTASRPARLLIHPRCVHLIEAFRSYRRQRRGSEWLDAPADPQHPHEDLMDALRGGLVDRFPGGLRPESKPYAKLSPRQWFK